MNKDVIYIEPDDDITDIITKIESSKEKIIALVPPKKAGVFRSIVNIKLITKAGNSANKTIVLVTTDPSIVKLAAATRLPVTKNLQSAPVIPEAEETEPTEATSTEEITESDTPVLAGVTDDDEDEDYEETEPETTEDDENTSDAEEPEEAPAKAKDKKKPAKPLSKNPVIAWIQQHKKIVIAAGVGVILLIILLIWMFVIAPAVTVTVGIRTTSANFSENISFTSDLAAEDAATGKFYYEEKKNENKSEVKFTATGKKNVGEKASGEMVVYAYFSAKDSIPIDAGATFTTNGLTFVSTADKTLIWDGKLSSCENADDEVVSGHFQCLISGRVPVVAEISGEAYNIPATPTADWRDSIAGLFAYNDKAMTGGTDKTVTVVQQSDVDAALEKLKDSNENFNKDKLLASVGENEFIVEASFKQSVSDAVSTPAVGEEVGSDGEAKLSVVTTDSVLVIDKTKVEEFIAKTAKLADNYKIYMMNDPFVENFTSIEGGYVGKLKTSYISGPEVTENDVIEIIKGKGLGSAQHDLKEISGVGNVRIDTSFPWVMHIPGNVDKITVLFDMEE